MDNLQYMITITNRSYSEDYEELFEKHGCFKVFKKLCHGTATHTTLDYLGLHVSEKVMFETVIRKENKNDLVRDLKLKMDITATGNGLAIFLPIDGIGGKSALNYLIGDKPIEKKENIMNEEKKENNLVLIITVADRGNTDIIMEAARGAGASGGTVVNAQGTGAGMAKFFGVSISEEKEMIYIVAKKEIRDNIMHAIMEKAGSNTDAHGILFSLPVDSIVGIKGLEND